MMLLVKLALLSAVAFAHERHTSRTGRTTVTVVGAGIGGITAARTLLDHSDDIDVTVLEANPSRYGGRMWSYPIPGHPGKFLEFGAMWLHGYADPNQPIRQYAIKHNIPTISNYYSDTNAQVFMGDNKTDVFAGTNYLPDLQSTFGLVADLGRQADFKENQPERSLREVIEDPNSKLRKIMAGMSPTQQRFLVLFLEDEEGTKFDNISTRSYPPEVDEAEETAAADMGFGHVVPSGYIQIVESIVRGDGNRPVSIKLGEQVTGIKLKNKQVTVTTSTGNAYHSDYVVVAVPLGILQADVIDWEPELKSSKHKAIKRMGFGNFVKGVLLFDKQFWPEDKNYMFHFPQSPDRNHIDTNLPRVYFVSLVPVNNVTGLVAILNGPYADLADSLSEEELQATLLRVLKHIHGEAYDRVQPTVTYFHRTDWRTNDLYRGAYSYGKLGMRESDPEEVRRPIRNRIFFAGEHTMFDEGTSASVVGAYESGIQAAEEIIDQL